ncbi:MAG: hypothetical protein JST54_15725 [Deltaproteobacteria bacterium]|nr:hypothetical protein [Deltaproteobacteria bacterium]
MNRVALGALALAAFAWLGCGHTCAPDNCSGCCDAAGVCQPGTQAADCGTLGNSCVTCGAGQTCNIVGVCTSPGGNSGNGTNGSGNNTTSGSGNTTGTATGGTTGTSATNGTTNVSTGTSATNGTTNVGTSATNGTTGTSATTSNTTTGTTGFTTGTTGTSTTGSTTSGGNSVTGDVSFVVRGALGEYQAGFVAWALADSNLTCPMLYGDAGLNARVVVGITLASAPGTYSLNDGGAVLEEGQVIASSISNPYTAYAGYVDYSQVSSTGIVGTYSSQMAQDGGGTIQISGSFDVAICPVGP